jgi:hypothetical protein
VRTPTEQEAFLAERRPSIDFAPNEPPRAEDPYWASADPPHGGHEGARS